MPGDAWRAMNELSKTTSFGVIAAEENQAGRKLDGFARPLDLARFVMVVAAKGVESVVIVATERV